MFLFPYVQRSSDEGVSISISVCIFLCVALAMGSVRAICNVFVIVLDV